MILPNSHLMHLNFSVQDEEAEQIKVLTKKLYDFSKIKEFPSKQTEALSKLVIANLDDEQIWQQIELNNNSLYNNLVNYTARLLALKSKLKFPLKKKEVQEQINGKRKDENKDNCHADSTSESEEIETDEEKGKKNSLKKSNKSSIVDDKFFKLHEMEEFLEKVESKNDNDNEDDEFINYFVESSSDSDIENQPKYNDFFDEPEGEEKNHKKKRKLSTEIKETKGEKKVKFALNDNSDTDENYSSNEENLLNDSNKNGDAEEYSEDMGSEEVSDNDSGDEKENENDKKNEPPSTFELRQERLKSRISALEEKALKAKPWQMKGEITADDRPQNSLLEEYVEFDVAVRPAPVLTEKSTLKLEDIIIQRIKDKAWDDVVRKIKPIENEIEYKKKLVLDQEKSKLSLAQIYEQEYLKQVENKATEDVIDKPEIEPPEHVEIKSLLKNLFVKLDALSNFHFTPTPVS